MKLTMIEDGSGTKPAALLRSGAVLDLAAAAAAGFLRAGFPESLIQILDERYTFGNDVRRLVDDVESDVGDIGARLTRAQAFFDPQRLVYAPILRPGLIVSCGKAYGAHNAEMNTGIMEAPSAFLKSPNSITSHRRPIVLPLEAPDMVDFEGEFCCVIGRPMHNVEVEHAMEYVAGYTMANDVSSRRWVPAYLKERAGDPQKCADFWVLNIHHKQFPTFCPLGPVIVTADELGDPNDVHFTTTVNGKQMQSATTADLVFPIAHSLAYFSKIYNFEPGDVVTTGTPGGVGFGRTPQVFLREGDVVEVSCDGIGVLRNSVVAAARDSSTNDRPAHSSEVATV